MKNTLVVIPAAGVCEEAGGVRMDVKFATGMDMYARLWDGPVRCLVRPVSASTLPFSRIYSPQDLRWKVDIGSVVRRQDLEDAAVVSLGMVVRNFPAGRLCYAMGVPYVAVIVNSLRTMLDIAWIDGVGLLGKARGCLRIMATEIPRISIVKRAAGLQAYQVPAYRRYAKYSRNPLMIFDSRNDSPIEAEVLEQRLRYLDDNRPLRLAFSGRLTKIKGVDVFPALMDALPHMTLDVYGSGELASTLQHPRIRLHGSVDFERRLMPALKNSVDIFLCCHRQGDPSGTYMETFACGVPIVGFRNEALAGIIDMKPVGVAVAMGDVKALASAIRALDLDRERLKTLARNSRAFAMEHRFSETFDRRVRHLKAASAT